jgi:repressor of nif and glnA expression
VLNELAALNDDLAGMLKAQANERRVLEYKIEELGIAISGGILGTAAAPTPPPS